MPELRFASSAASPLSRFTPQQLANAGLTPHTGDLLFIPERPRALPVPPLSQIFPAVPTVPISDPSGTAPHTGPIVTTRELEDAARRQMASDAIKSALMFTGIAEFAGTVIHPRNPHLADVVGKDVAGFEMKPIPGSNRARPAIGRVSILGLGPAPLGYVPPELYGLEPDFLIQKEKRLPLAQQRTIGIEIVGALGGNPGGARQQYADALAADAAAAKYQQRVGRLVDHYVLNDFLYPQLAIAGASPSQVRPDEIRAIAEAELRRRGLAVPDIPGVTTAAPGSGSIQPELITPINDKAIANQAKAKGLQKELVSERADP